MIRQLVQPLASDSEPKLLLCLEVKLGIRWQNGSRLDQRDLPLWEAAEPTPRDSLVAVGVAGDLVPWR